MRRGAPVLVLVCAAVSLSAAQPSRTFTGVITDDMCPLGDHSRMQMGPTDAECAKACAMAHASPYVLYDGRNVYRLSDQKRPEEFAAQRVTVVGTVDSASMTIQVESIAAVR